MISIGVRSQRFAMKNTTDNKIKAVLFDCFGVLVGGTFHDTYRLAGGNPFADHEFIENLLAKVNSGEITEAEFNGAICNKIGISFNEWDICIDESETVNEQLLEYIAKIRRKYKTAIVSNASSGVVESKIGSIRLKEIFDAVVVSAEVGYMKPDPMIYRITADRLSVKPEDCIFVDDKQSYCRAAQALGMTVVLYKYLDQLKQDITTILNW